MRAASSRWVLALDNDAVVAPDTLEKLAAALAADEDAAIAQPRSVFFAERDRVHYDGGRFHYGGLIALRNFYETLASAEGSGTLAVDCAVAVALLVDRDGRARRRRLRRDVLHPVRGPRSFVPPARARSEDPVGRGRDRAPQGRHGGDQLPPRAELPGVPRPLPLAQPLAPPGEELPRAHARRRVPGAPRVRDRLVRVRARLRRRRRVVPRQVPVRPPAPARAPRASLVPVAAPRARSRSARRRSADGDSVDRRVRRKRALLSALDLLLRAWWSLARHVSA
jgi:hypothetical protein